MQTEDQTETRHMTVAEIALVREIVKWRQANGITFWRPQGRLLGDFVSWSEGHPWDRKVRHVSVHYHTENRGGGPVRVPEMTISTPVPADLLVGDEWSVTQAVDMLCALGFLPPRFSSAYRAGWNAAHSTIGVPNEDICDLERALRPLAAR